MLLSVILICGNYSVIINYDNKSLTNYFTKLPQAFNSQLNINKTHFTSQNSEKLRWSKLGINEELTAT